MVYIGQKSFRIYKSIEDKNIDEPVFKCDELLAPTIQLLNMLGYKTTYCCSGHLADIEFDKNILKDHPDFRYHGECYIAFEKSVEELRKSGFVPISETILMSDADANIMKEFTFKNEHGMAVLRRTFPKNSTRLFEMMNSAAVLIKWAPRLISANGIEDAVNKFVENKSYDFQLGMEGATNE